jgi:hypothetical protein
MKSTQVFEFSIPSFVTQRQWCVYLIVATNITSKTKEIYVGKVGDNREGCNPIISRIGNHFSHNTIHSQFRNQLEVTTDFDYKIYFATFGQYIQSNKAEKDKINQLERQLSILVETAVKNVTNINFKKPYKGTGYLSKTVREYRNGLLTEDDKVVLQEMVSRFVKQHSS